MVRCDNATRFPVLSLLVARAEYSDCAGFEGGASLAFVNRNLPVPEVTVARRGGGGDGGGDGGGGWCNITAQDTRTRVSSSGGSNIAAKT